MTDLLLRRDPLYDAAAVPRAYRLTHSGTRAVGFAQLLAGNRAKSLARGLPLLLSVSSDELHEVVALASDVELWLSPAEGRLDTTALQAWTSLPAGVKVVIGDPAVAAGHGVLADVADAVHVDAEHLDVNEITQRTQQFVANRLYVTGVHRGDLAARCRLLGADLLAGQYLSDVNADVTKVVAGDRLTLLQLMTALQSPQVAPDTVTRMVEQSPAVSFELLRWVNSAYVGLRNPVDQIGRAVSLLGPGRVRQVVSLLLTRELSDRPTELSRTALLRGRMCEQVGAALGDGRPAYYIAGMFSMLDVLLETSLENLVEQLPLTDEVTDALLHHDGVVGRTLQATKLYERADFEDPVLDTFTPAVLSAAYLDALVYADDVIGAVAAA